MATFAISASLKFKEDIRKIMEEASKLGMTALFPNLDFEGELTSENLKMLTLDHFKAIDESQALYVWCPSGYIGRSVTLEIGYARAKGIPIFYSERTNDLVIDSLCTDIVSFDRLQGLVTRL